MIRGKLAAFTILEMTVSMLLAAITIGIAYSAYSVIAGSYREYDRKNKKLAEFVQLNRLLKKDMGGSDHVTALYMELSVTKGNQIIKYDFTPDYITRSQNELHTDTFIIKNSGFAALFENKVAEQSGLVDKINLSTVLEGSSVPLSFTREYSSEELINYKK